MKPFRAQVLEEIPAKAVAEIKERIYREVAPLKTQAFLSREPLPYSQRERGEHVELNVGDAWGGLFDCAWFHFTGRVPEECAGESVVLLLDVNGEGCVYDAQGTPYRGITCVDSEFDRNLGLPGKRVVRFAATARGGEEVDVWVDAGNNDLFGNYRGGLKCAKIAVCREDVRQLYYDYLTLHRLYGVLPDASPRKYAVLYALTDAARLLTRYGEREVSAARKALRGELSKKGGDPSLTLYALGHAHLDLAWLWPVRESKRKAARTFSTALELAARYPGYIFGASQPQQYDWMKRDYPALYARIKEGVRAGSIEPLGCMWVEADTNLTGGESLVRQVLYGLRFFSEEFGVVPDILWLPDVFGFSAAVPQIMQKSGVKYMLTIKPSWNKYTQLPNHTFLWKGNGGELLVHMPPDGSYNSAASPDTVARSQAGYLERGLVDRAMMVYGIGDGGGGPGPEHLESLARLRDLDGLCPVRNGTAESFFHGLERFRGKLNTYCGELYLQRHQGTYTSQGSVKYHNRRVEGLLHDAELALAAKAALYGGEYPALSLEEIWKRALLYQFHDVLPGSSIGRVYDECLRDYADMETQLENLLEEALPPGGTAVFNPTGFRISGFAEADGWRRVEARPWGVTALGEKVENFRVKAGRRTLENGLLRAEFNVRGELAALFRKGGGENLVAAPGGNLLRVWKDGEDAWELPAAYFEGEGEQMRLLSSRSYTRGPYAILEQEFAYGESRLFQTVRLQEGGDVLEFDNRADWRQGGVMLRAEFHTGIHSPQAVCGIQFGRILRPATSNDIGEYAQFEVAAHRYAMLCDGQACAAVLSDCKYGYRVKGECVSLNLLRTPSYPDPRADRGEHRFRYGLYCGDAEQIEQRAYAFAGRLYLTGGEEYCLAEAEPSNIVGETVKRSEDGCRTVMRFYESAGRTTRARIALHSAFRRVCLADLLERPKEQLALSGQTLELEFKPFEIHTLLLD